MKTQKLSKVMNAELKGEIDFYLGVHQNPYPAGTAEAAAWLDGQGEGLINSDETYLTWQEALRTGLPQDAGARDAFIAKLVRDGKLGLLDALLQAEKPHSSGDFLVQFRNGNGLQGQRHHVTVYRYRSRFLVQHAIPDLAPLLFLEDPLLNGCVWTRVRAL